MDDSALIEAYGKHELPEGTADRPLVTFALFAYNQEQYIREAVEGAFSQTYEPLEIILSDDCSKDNTYKIMRNLAENYRGPHSLRLNRCPINLGTAAHVSAVFSLSRGKLFVVAAGDDISGQERVTKIVSAWNAQGQPPALIHSAMIQFEEGVGNDITLLPAKKRSLKSICSLNQFVVEWRMPARGPNCAYSRDIFERFPQLTAGSVIEDLPLMVRSLALAQIIYIDESLVMARKLNESAGQGFSILHPHRWNRFLHSRMTALYDVIRDSIMMEESVDFKILRALRCKARRKMVSHARLVLDLQSKVPLFRRIQMTLQIVFGEAISGGLGERIKFAILFSFPEIHER
jgi:glycosyltransferase involved in cell wall biosynthesis